MHLRHFLCVTLILCACQSGVSGQEGDQESASTEPEPASIERGIEIVRRAQGVFVYTYAETMDEIDPLTDYETKRRITDSQVIRELKQLMVDNEDYSPNFRARCLPVWDYGIEFRESEEQRSIFLFSFRCNTVKYVNGNLFKDFSPQATRLYALLQYEVSERTTEPPYYP